MTPQTLQLRREGGELPLLQRGDAFGLRAALETLRHYRGLAATVFTLVLGVTLLYWLLAVPVFKADTLLQIASRSRATLLPNLEAAQRSSGTPDAERREVAGEIEILRSRDILLPVIEAVGADLSIGGAKRWGFVPVGARHGVQLVRMKLPAAQQGRDFRLAVDSAGWTLSDDDNQVVAQGASGVAQQFQIGGQTASIEVRAPADVAPTRLTVRQDRALRAYENVVDRLRMFEPSRESGVLRISFEDADPERAAALLNAMVAKYLERTVARRADEGGEALTFLQGQLPQFEARVRAAEDALSAYQQTTAAVPLSIEADALLRQRGELERQAMDLQMKREQLAQLLTPAHPDLAAVQAQLGNVRRALARMGASTNALPAQQRDLVRLQRDVQISTQQYTAMLERAQQLRIAGAGLVADARQLDLATVPIEAVRPKAPALMSIGLGLATLLSLAAVLLARAMRTTVSDVLEIESQFSHTTLARIPQSANQPRLMDGRLREAVETDMGTHRLLARAAPQDPAVEGLRSVHLSLTLRARSIAAKVVLVTSPSYGAGKSFVASNLAALMAETGKRVLLMEADMRHPAVHRYVGLDVNAAGLSDVLCGARTLEEVIYPHASANMDALMAGTMTDNPGSLLLMPALAETLDTLRAQYDHIVIHGTPLRAIGDALAVGRSADCALLVVRSEQSLLEEANDAVRQLEQAGIRLEGVIFNGVRASRQSDFSQI